MSVISMKQLLEAGVHFGHQTRRWNPKMAEYIYTERNGIYIIDLQKSVGMVDDAYKAVADIAADMMLRCPSRFPRNLLPCGKSCREKNACHEKNSVIQSYCCTISTHAVPRMVPVF